MLVLNPTEWIMVRDKDLDVFVSCRCRCKRGRSTNIKADWLDYLDGRQKDYEEKIRRGNALPNYDDLAESLVSHIIMDQAFLGHLDHFEIDLGEYSKFGILAAKLTIEEALRDGYPDLAWIKNRLSSGQ